MQLTKAMAVALAPSGIRVNAVGPGTIDTPLIKDVVKDEAFRTKVLSRTPLGRFGAPAEVAAIVAWLLSEEASYVTGTTVYADGGRMPLNYVMKGGMSFGLVRAVAPIPRPCLFKGARLPPQYLIARVTTPVNVARIARHALLDRRLPDQARPRA